MGCARVFFFFNLGKDCIIYVSIRFDSNRFESILQSHTLVQLANPMIFVDEIPKMGKWLITAEIDAIRHN